jgi:hypothetical protein
MTIRIALVAAGLGLGAFALYHPVAQPFKQTAAAVTRAPALATTPSGEHARRPRHRATRRAGRRSHGSCLPRSGRRTRRRAAAPSPAPNSVSVNAGDADQLAKVPGLGRAIAERIVALRAQEGAYDSLDELLDVAGMNAARLDRASPYLRL